MQTLLLPSDRKLGICHRMVPLRVLYIVIWPTFSMSRIWNMNIWKRVKARKNAQVWLYRGWYLPSNGTIAIGVLRDLDIHFQGRTLSYYAFTINQPQAVDVPGRFASTRTALATELLLLHLKSSPNQTCCLIMQRLSLHFATRSRPMSSSVCYLRNYTFWKR